ncbi:H/ACA ribonucleoprotein complex subunit NHP2 [Colletotrichum sidae]|uniref:H/ACA ribonucleoprotein complex subunit 2 n=2 Tax=Colletotrichum orbiculare species complex TaxID=2707354 RepID=A0A4R8RP69_COLTR|nr:H/ACA ribonucleoprotein complex subunit NHP2 [Colletotrichum trifolii]TEA20072.1 H/ACA ribonucleoprotein complex subunit NHP2 [Colletotrichum sidae]
MAAEKPERKEKKDKKRSVSDGGISKSKKDKKEKKEKKDKLERVLDEHLQADVGATAVDAGEIATKEAPVVGALVPFAVPLADEKAMKKVMKTIRKAAKNNTLKRGVKEVVKTLRKSPASAPNNTSFPGVVIIAGDISPMDVISHIPVLCEDHNVPFIFVTSRAELGAAAKTKRPTSVVMITEKRSAADAKKADKKTSSADADDEDDGEDYSEVYAALIKLVQKETAKQAFWQ